MNLKRLSQIMDFIKELESGDLVNTPLGEGKVLEFKFDTDTKERIVLVEIGNEGNVGWVPFSEITPLKIKDGEFDVGNYNNLIGGEFVDTPFGEGTVFEVGEEVVTVVMSDGTHEYLTFDQVTKL